jgi:phosphoadenosine phosphosulfate reductase
MVCNMPTNPQVDEPVAPDLSAAGLAQTSARLERLPATEAVRWATRTFGPALVLTTSLTDAVLVHLAWTVDPAIDVVFIDTGYHFPETLETLETVKRRYRPAGLRVVRAETPLDDRWRTDTDACCAARKVVPLERALDGKRAWLSGLRRSDSPERADTAIVERDRRGLVKINPLATWSDADVERYVRDHDVPVNPLVARGYPSVGCAPCTHAVADGDDPRSGRWAGTEKTECGLHL